MTSRAACRFDAISTLGIVLNALAVEYDHEVVVHQLTKALCGNIAASWHVKTTEMCPTCPSRRPKSRIAVCLRLTELKIYDQQSRKGKVVDESGAKQGCGRPRRQYRVYWEDSYIDGARLAAPGLLQNWRERRRLNVGVEGTG